eukprot:11197496-Lingulodinium_polyedra.AAC.1
MKASTNAIYTIPTQCDAMQCVAMLRPFGLKVNGYAVVVCAQSPHITLACIVAMVSSTGCVTLHAHYWRIAS